MKSLYQFIVKPFEQRYSNVKKLNDKELIVNTRIENHIFVSKKAVVVSTPAAFKTNINVGDTLKPNDFIWYDLSDIPDYAGDRIRFQYTYIKKENILKGLDEFYKCAKFCSSDKPAKRQKRYDRGK